MVCRLIFVLTAWLLSHAPLFVTSWTVTHLALLLMGILWARILEWIDMPSSRGPSKPRDPIHIARMTGGFFTLKYKTRYLKVKMLVTQSCLTLCDPMDCSRLGSCVHWDSPGKNTDLGCHFILQGNFPTPGSNLDLPHCRQILYHLSYKKIMVWNICQFSWYKYYPHGQFWYTNVMSLNMIWEDICIMGFQGLLGASSIIPTHWYECK